MGEVLYYVGFEINIALVVPSVHFVCFHPPTRADLFVL
eukprot:COSAG02_NODE_2921_length_7747_cov_9.003400_6_plen_38_part_00